MLALQLIPIERQMMSTSAMKDNQVKAAITVSEMCSILGMSRPQFYEHVKRGTFHQPMRLSNGRPFFNASQVEDNIKAKELGVGVNGEYVIAKAGFERVDKRFAIARFKRIDFQASHRCSQRMLPKRDRNRR
jgi:predicted DNA-binding transcriptional regulator AlpA